MINATRSRNDKKYHLPLLMEAVIRYNKEKANVISQIKEVIYRGKRRKAWQSYYTDKGGVAI